MTSDRQRVLWVTKPLDAPFNDGSKVMPRSLIAKMDPRKLAICVSKDEPRHWPVDLKRCRAYTRADSFHGRFSQNLSVFFYLLAFGHRFRALHFFFAPNPLSCRAARLLKTRLPGVPFVQTIMSRPKIFDAELLFGDRIIALSEDTKAHFERVSGRQIELIRPITPPVSTFPLTPEHKTLLFAGDIDHGGALPHLAAIVPPLLEANPSLHFVFSVRSKRGEETRQNATRFFTEHFERFAHRAVMHVDHKNFGALLRQQSAMIFPAENLYTKVDAPLVVLESLALGKPVFMLDRAPLSEIPGPELSPRLIGENDEELILKIQNFMDEGMPPELIQSATRPFDPTLAAARLEAIYSALPAPR